MMCETSLHRKFDKFSAELHPIPVRDEVWHTCWYGHDWPPSRDASRKQVHNDSIVLVFLSGQKQQHSLTSQQKGLLHSYSNVSVVMVVAVSK